ncbi:Inositol-3,4-bisphosphate 4-phosphatase [Phytophthora palmivora]|uniref:Inositol-3,4-bisphosphate 4-phosphatase n=1 Tax=Phytophthora palmivora TaxID=4796 RepID=A0A2P4XBV7_9STRA|nr:Inositol-3,4-bisphosphate 4-phosphatase [Phytophthora palmivora]
MAAPQSPNLMSFDDEPSLMAPAPTSASSVESVEASSFPLVVPTSPVEIPPSDTEARQVLHFFVSCRGVDGNSLVSPARSAQTLVRGAFNMLSSATTSTKSPRTKPPTEVNVEVREVNVEVRVSRETPIFGFDTDISVQTAIPPAPTSGGLTIEMDNFGELGAGFTDKAALPTDGLLDSESYWSERHKSYGHDS